MSADRRKVIRLLTAQAAGTDDVLESDTVDVSGYRRAMFLTQFGAITAGATLSVKIAQSSDDDDADSLADLAGSGVAVPDTASDQVVVHEIVHPRERYLAVRITRADENAVIDGVVCVLSDPVGMIPTEDDADTVVARRVLQGPAEGTA